MAVAHATAAIGFGTDSGTGSISTGDQTFSHAGDANAKGAFVIVQGVGTAAHVTGVLYGGQAMGLVATGIDATEPQSARIYFLDQPPQGTQTVTLQGCTASGKHAVAGTVTAATASTQIVGSGNLDTQSSTNPTLTFNLTAAGQVYGALCGGAAAETSYAVGAGETLIGQGPDHGALSGRWTRSTNAAGAGNYTVDFTYGTIDDWALVAIAIGETPAAPSLTVPRHRKRTGLKAAPGLTLRS